MSRRDSSGLERRVVTALCAGVALALGGAGLANFVSGRVAWGAYLLVLAVVALVAALAAARRGVPEGNPTDWSWKGRIVLGVAALVLAACFYLFRG